MQTNQWIWSSIMSKKQIKIKKLNNSIVGHGISLRPFLTIGLAFNVESVIINVWIEQQLSPNSYISKL